jgi:TolB protein
MTMNTPAKTKNRHLRRIVFLLSAILILLTLTGVILGKISTPHLFNMVVDQQTSLFSGATSLPTFTLIPSEISTGHPQEQTPTFIPSRVPSSETSDGTIILSMEDGNYAHLFAYNPVSLPLTRITNNEWDDITPAISPDGAQIAFSSKRNGYWDLYLLNLSDGNLIRLTDTYQYDASPTWSPDGQWIAYESYVDDNLELFIINLQDLASPPIRLTNDPSADHSPVWSPQGRTIAFCSNRSGEEEIWLARLDMDNDRFTNISSHSNGSDRRPAWSPDGNYLAWASENDGIWSLLVQDIQNENTRVIYKQGSGNWPVWSPDGTVILSEISDPFNVTLGGYNLNQGTLAIPLFQLPGALRGLDWKAGNFPDLIQKRLISEPQDNLPLWQSAVTIIAPLNRMGVVALTGVTAPFPFLLDSVDESFESLRNQVAKEAGWNFLDSLENAFIPINEALSPEMEQDWLYTGRAFSVNPLPLYAGWMVVTREDYAGQTYWRIYVKTRYQDGSQGEPMNCPPWDLSARYNGNTQSYENGGQYLPIPTGYWIDFTKIAARYGWKPLPTLSNWRTYFSGTRFNEFVMDDGQNWITAMEQLYPPEALATATRVPTKTLTPTATPRHYETDTITPTILPTDTSTPQPTWTQSP